MMSERETNQRRCAACLDMRAESEFVLPDLCSTCAERRHEDSGVFYVYPRAELGAD